MYSVAAFSTFPHKNFIKSSQANFIQLYSVCVHEPIAISQSVHLSRNKSLLRSHYKHYIGMACDECKEF